MVLGLLEEIVAWLRPAFDDYGYVLVLGAVLLERSILLGLIVPGELILALGAVFAARGELSLVPLLIGAVIAATVGETIGYWLGRRYGRPLVRHLPFGARAEKQIDKVHDLFERSGGPTVAIGRYATGAGAFVPLVAGMSGMPLRTFLAWDVPAIAVWATGVGLIGFLLGDNLDTVERILQRFGLIALGILIVFIGVTVWRRRRSQVNP